MGYYELSTEHKSAVRAVETSYAKRCNYVAGPSEPSLLCM